MKVFCNLPRSLFLMLMVIASVTILVLFEKTIAPEVKNWGGFYPAVLTFLVILSKVVLPLVLLRWRYGLGLRSLGWVEGGLFQAVWKGVVVAALMMIVILIYKHYSPLVFHTLYLSTGEHFLQQEMSRVTIMIGIAAALLNAFGEEIIFRGMLLPSLSIHLGVLLAVIIHAILFSAYHFFPLQNSVLLFIMGILFGVGYLWSGSLLTPVLAHLIENGVPIVVLLTGVMGAG